MNEITAFTPEELIGNTPLVSATRMFPGANVFIKPEWLNPGGSIKDRIALHLINKAEFDGLLKPGGVIVEPTSGNTGAGLALIAAQRGYKCIFTCSDKVSEEKVSLLRALGAEVVITSSLASSSDADSYISIAKKIASETPNAWMPDQYHSYNNPEAHELSTGPEIWDQTQGKVTHVLATTGTGGTLTGIARYLKKMSPSIKIIGVDPVGSVYSGQNPQPYLVEGPGKDDIPPFWQKELIDDFYIVSDEDAFHFAREFARKEGLLVGGSSGLVLAAVDKLIKNEKNAAVVALLPDSGRAYLSKIYNDRWMVTNGFQINSNGKSNIDSIKIVDLPYGQSVSECQNLLAAGNTIVALSPSGPVTVLTQIEKVFTLVNGKIETVRLSTAGYYDQTINDQTLSTKTIIIKNGRVLGYIE